MAQQQALASGKLGTLQLMARIVEYYEVKTRNGYEYYSMPVDPDAKNKQNMDGQSHRIWKVDTKTDRITEIKNIREHRPQVTKIEMLTIQLKSKPVPFEDYYLQLQEMKRYREQHKTEKSSTVDQVQDT